MFQYLKLMALLLLLMLLQQLDLSHSLPLTTAPGEECPTCVTNPAQTQAPEHFNGTSLGIGDPCGVYTASCAPGLRCAPPQGEQGPLRALLEGRGVCSNASSVAPTPNTRTAGKSHAGRVWVKSLLSLWLPWCCNKRELCPLFFFYHVSICFAFRF